MLYSAVQPGGFLFGLQASNPVYTDVAYRGFGWDFGSQDDGMVGGKIGGVNVFGGGLALYSGSTLIGALGVSGDTSCADHAIAWRTRELLSLDSTPTNDNIIYDIAPDGNGHPVSAGGFGHPKCAPSSPVP